MKKSWFGCWCDSIKMRFLLWKEGLPIPRRKNCHCEESLYCFECHRLIDLKKIQINKMEPYFVSWSCPHCHTFLKFLQCPSCQCLSPENIAHSDIGWVCTTCLSSYPNKPL